MSINTGAIHDDRTAIPNSNVDSSRDDGQIRDLDNIMHNMSIEERTQLHFGLTWDQLVSWTILSTELYRTGAFPDECFDGCYNLIADFEKNPGIRELFEVIVGRRWIQELENGIDFKCIPPGLPQNGHRSWQPVFATDDGEGPQFMKCRVTNANSAVKARDLLQEREKHANTLNPAGLALLKALYWRGEDDPRDIALLYLPDECVVLLPTAMQSEVEELRQIDQKRWKELTTIAKSGLAELESESQAMVAPAPATEEGQDTMASKLGGDLSASARTVWWMVSEQAFRNGVFSELRFDIEARVLLVSHAKDDMGKLFDHIAQRTWAQDLDDGLVPEWLPTTGGWALYSTFQAGGRRYEVTIASSNSRDRAAQEVEDWEESMAEVFIKGMAFEATFGKFKCVAQGSEDARVATLQRLDSATTAQLPQKTREEAIKVQTEAAKVERTKKMEALRKMAAYGEHVLRKE